MWMKPSSWWTGFGSAWGLTWISSVLIQVKFLLSSILDQNRLLFPRPPQGAPRRSESLSDAAAICHHQPAGWHRGTDVHSAVWAGHAERQDTLIQTAKQNMEIKNLENSEQKCNNLGNWTTNFSQLSCLRCWEYFYFCRKKNTCVDLEMS